MDINNPHNQSYWFVLREDQSNVIFSSNNVTIQNPPRLSGHDTRYIVDTSDNRSYIHQIEADHVQETTSETSDRDPNKLLKDEFWDRNKIKSFLTLCLDSRFRSNGSDKLMWNEMATILGTNTDECIKKYRNLKRTYVRLLKKRGAGNDIKWAHFQLCEEVFKDCKSIPLTSLEPWHDSKVRRLLSLYIENLNKFRNPTCLQKDIWRDIAAELDTTKQNCYHKFKSLKRTYFTRLERSDNGKSVNWPYHQYFERIFYNYDPNASRWSRIKIKQLLDAYAHIAHKFQNSKIQKKELWKEIALSLGETPSNCDRKFRNLKQTYIKLRLRAEGGKTVTKWRYYKDFEEIYNNPPTYDEGPPRLLYRFQEDNYIKQLLIFYVENKEKFRDPLIRKKSLWKIIGPRIGLTSVECDKKFRNLKQTYIRLAEKKKITGKISKWPYYTYFEQIYEGKIDNKSNHYSNHIDECTLSEIKRVVQCVEDRKDSEKFEKLIKSVEESNEIQRERNRILQALLDRK